MRTVYRLALLVCLLVLMGVFLGACGDDEEASTTTSAAVVPPPDGIAEAGVIRFCTSFDAPPQEFIDDSGNYAGSDVDLGNAIAGLMGVEVEWVPMSFDGIIAALQASKCDAINSSMAYRPSRDEVVDYVIYGKFATAVVVLESTSLAIDEPIDLSGRQVGFVTGYQDAGIKEIDAAIEAEGLPGMEIVSFARAADALQALKVGGVEAVAITSTEAEYFAGLDPDLELAPFFAGDVPFGFGVVNGNRDLQYSLGVAIDALYEDGTFCQILEEWDLVTTAGPGYPCELSG